MGGYDVFSSGLVLVLASLFFSVAFVGFQKCLRRFWKNSLSSREIVSISMRCTSALQGILCCTAGVIIITQCQDLVYQSHWLTDTYVLIGTGYLVYDIWATYQCFIYNYPAMQQLPLVASFEKYIRNDPVMMFHHVGLPLVYFPVVMYYRGGVGDGLIGCFMMIEATVPFISFREILVTLKKTGTWLYIINGVLTLSMYTLSRIMIFPWIFWMYGKQIGRPWYQVPFILKPVCIGGTAVFLGLYLYWWFMILGIAKNEVKVWLSKILGKNKQDRSQREFTVSDEHQSITAKHPSDKVTKTTKLH